MGDLLAITPATWRRTACLWDSTLKIDVVINSRTKSSHRGELTVVVMLAGIAPR